MSMVRYRTMKTCEWCKLKRRIRTTKTSILEGCSDGVGQIYSVLDYRGLCRSCRIRLRKQVVRAIVDTTHLCKNGVPK